MARFRLSSPSRRERLPALTRWLPEDRGLAQLPPRRLRFNDSEAVRHSAACFWSQELNSAGHLVGRQLIVDQNHASEHFPDGRGLLLAVADARVGHALRMEPEKVIVLCHESASGRCGELKLRNVGPADQARVRGSGHVDVAPPKTGRDVGRDVFVQVKTNGHRSGCFFQPLLAQLRFEQRWIVTAEFVRKRAFRLHLLLDLFEVIEVVGEGGVDVGKSDRGEMRDDLVGRHALVLMPHHHIEYTDAMAGDARLAAANVRRPADPVGLDMFQV